MEEKSNIKIEGNEATWECNFQSEIKGTCFGTFKFRCILNPIQVLAAGRDYRDLLGPHMTLADSHEERMAFALSQLKYRIISAPPFWSSSMTDSNMPGNLPDINLLDHVLNAAIESQMLYMAQLKERKDKALSSAHKAAEKLTEEESDEDTNEKGSD